jgi:acyl carrier protein phosphodiesterase
MKDERRAQDSASLIEKALITLTEKVDRLDAVRKDMKDLEIEMKALKLFLCKKYPELKEQFPDIIRKVSKKT